MSLASIGSPDGCLYLSLNVMGVRFGNVCGRITKLEKRPTSHKDSEPRAPNSLINVSKEKQPKDKVFGQDIPGRSGTQTSGYPGCKRSFSVVLDREWPGCPGIWVGTSRIWKHFMQENFGLTSGPFSGEHFIST